MKMKDERGLVFGVWCSVFALLPLGCHAFHLDQPAPLPRTEKDTSTAQSPTPPSKYSFRIPPYVFLSDFELKRDQPIFHELEGLRNQVYKELQLPSADRLIQVYVFEDKERYERFIHAQYPDLPSRRAFFVAQPRAVGPAEDLLVYTYWGERIQEDLRHELTHALLHSVLKNVPLWLDEGLAEYFEVPPEENGVNRQHLDQILHGQNGSFHPDLARLEQLSQVEQMKPAEYREAWAWVHLLLRDRAESKSVLVNYLQQLRVTPDPGVLGPRLRAVYAAPNEVLTRHLAQVDLAASPRRAQAVPSVQ
jgi:hypothetical protein